VKNAGYDHKRGAAYPKLNGEIEPLNFFLPPLCCSKA
jgi:hypothetical protein